MRVTEVTRVSAKPKHDATPIAKFTIEIANGIRCRLVLAKSDRDGADLIWSRRDDEGPCVLLNPSARTKIAALVREELSAIASAA